MGWRKGKSYEEEEEDDEDSASIYSSNSNNNNAKPAAAAMSHLQIAGGRAVMRVRDAYQRKSVVIATAIAVLIIASAALGVSLVQHKQSVGNLTRKGPRLPLPEVSPPVQQANRDQLLLHLSEVYTVMGASWDFFSDETSPQFTAMNWLAGRSAFVTYSPAQRVQRFALASLYYATFMVGHDFLADPTDWKRQEGWITDASECTWKGVSCNNQGHVIAIVLPDNAISGSIPFEMAFLSQLQEVDFTTNYIYLEDELHDFWMHLTNLRIIKMEDNFVVTIGGLPTQFASLVNIEKIQMSYNLLQGPLNGQTFLAMANLQHLEVESNYLSGPIPVELGALRNLVYFYARRNLLEIFLPNMIIPGAYPSLFSLWLDNNDISGSIPSAIGQITELASFSVTNSSLTGTIPTEFGLLQGLKRVWMYDNDLTGTIPQELSNLQDLQVFEIHNNRLRGEVPSSICVSVAATDYQFKALTADCDAVACNNCCTECY